MLFKTKIDCNPTSLVTDPTHLENLEQEVTFAKTLAADPHTNVIAFYGYITVTRKHATVN